MKTVVNLVKNHKVIFGVACTAINCAGIFAAYKIGESRGEQAGAEAMMHAAAAYHPEFPKEFMEFIDKEQNNGHKR